VLRTAYGVVACSFMMAMYALERRGRGFVLAFALGCVASAVYGLWSGAWPFGAVEGIWSLVAIRRWRRSGPGAASGAARPYSSSVGG
jgi:hypothetical protein